MCTYVCKRTGAPLPLHSHCRHFPGFPCDPRAWEPLDLVALVLSSLLPSPCSGCRAAGAGVASLPVTPLSWMETFPHTSPVHF